MSIAEDIENFRRDVTKAVEDLEAIRWSTDKLTEFTVDELGSKIAQLQDLCEQVAAEIKRTKDCLIQINTKWGSEPLKRSTHTLTSSRVNSSFSPLLSGAIHFTQGGHKKYLDRHYWNSQDGEAMQQYRETLTTAEKRLISQIQGESWGHCYVTDILGYEEVFHGDSKSIRQGLDGIYLDPKGDALVVVEFKGQRSLESAAQQRPTWTLDTCQKIQRYQFPYDKVSEFEREAAAIILQQYEAGRTIRYEVIRTEVDPNTGKMWTQLEKQTRLEGDFPSP
jgi:uncharacterized small protein (DUF1192 family)